MTSRRVTIQTPLGEQLQFRQLDGTEELSGLFDFQIDLLSKSKSIDPKALLGKTSTVVGSHSPLPGGHIIPFHLLDKTALADKEHIFSWHIGQEMRPG